MHAHTHTHTTGQGESIDYFDATEVALQEFYMQKVKKKRVKPYIAK